MTLNKKQMFQINVGYCYNRVEDFQVMPGDPEDINCEWSSSEYIEELRGGLQRAGFNVIDVGEPVNLIEANKRQDIDVVFSIAEMRGYRFREILLPALCELLNIPYLFARPDAMFVTADKELSNFYAEQCKVAVPRSKVIRSAREVAEVHFDFPWIIKPNAEGGSMGVFTTNVVYDRDTANAIAYQLITEYNQPVIVQEFVIGKEYTVGIIEHNGHVEALTPLLVFGDDEKNVVFDKKLKEKYKYEKLFEKVKDEKVALKIKAAAGKIFKHIGCKDAARLDFKIDVNGHLYFIEINGLTDFHPLSAMVLSAKLSNIPYEELLKRITSEAINRKENSSYIKNISNAYSTL